ncbi:phosphatase PAP2 family protein [bacterium]|nr:phosphatase PAP2 family protein [bacterium]
MFLTSDNKMRWLRLLVGAVVMAAVIGAGLLWFDVPVLMFMRQFDCRFWRVLSVIFDDKIWAGAFALAILGLYIKKTVKSDFRCRECRNGFSLRSFFCDFWQKTKNSNVFFIFCSILATGVVIEVLKIALGRARPILFEMVGLTGFFPPSFEWVFNSMPSGHTAISFAALVMMGMLAPRFKVPAWGLAILIGVARVCVGDHWPTDVLLGAFIGMVMADITKWGLARMSLCQK